MTAVHPDDSRTLRLGTGPIGVVVCHGFTGTTGSIRPWAEALARRGDTTVIAPRLTGHGTRWEDLHDVSWQEWQQDVGIAYQEVAERCDEVFVAGLSMGGALALRLAQLHPVAGVMLVNPAITTRDLGLRAVPVLRHVVKSQPGIASDIAKPGITEPGYDRVSVHAAWQMTRLWRQVRRDLSRVVAPILLMRSATDHVVDDLSGVLLRESFPDITEVVLEHSFHVATLDHDAELIADRSSAFIDGLVA